MTNEMREAFELIEAEVFTSMHLAYTVDKENEEKGLQAFADSVIDELNLLQDHVQKLMELTL